MAFTVLDNGRSFLRPVTEVRAIELTSRCNLRCTYCPSPNLGRAKIDMVEGTFARALEWVRYFVAQGTQGELNLAGIGESTLHPNLVHYLHRAREVIGPDRMLTFTTNGLLMTDELARAIAPARPVVGVSLHRPEKARPALDALRRAGVQLLGTSSDPSLASIDWAGQVDWPVDESTRSLRCGWLMDGMVMVMADGRVTACCLDASGAQVVGDITDDPATAQTHPGPLCAKCHHVVPVLGFRQRPQPESPPDHPLGP